MALKRAAAYVRVSSEEQTEGWSLDGQETQIREYAARNDYEIVQVYRDETSGSQEKRPGFDRMLLDAHAGLFEAVIVLHTSRFFRNVALARRYKDLFRNKLSIDIIFVNQPVVSPSDPSAFMLEGINELFDEYYLYQLRFWTTLGKQTRAQRGLYNGTLPFGYAVGEDGVPVAHPTDAAGVEMAFRAYATGRYSDVQIAELLNAHGFHTTGNWGERPFTKDTITPLLRNQFYLGYVKYKDTLLPGLHPALIDDELFDKCQAVRKSRGRQARSLGQTRRVYMLSGIARCHLCKLTLRCYATNSKGKWRYMRHTAEWRGYECSVPTISLRADFLEDLWGEIVSRIELPEGWRQRIEELSGDADEREAVLREREQVQEKLRRLKRAYVDGLMEDAEYDATRDRLQSRLAALVLPNSPHLVKAGEYLESLNTLWEVATLEEQREITRALLKAMYVDLEAERIVSLEPQPIFRMLFTDICKDLGVEIV